MLLLINDAKSEVDLLRPFGIWLHSHNLNGSFFGKLQGAIALVENTKTIPQFLFLDGVNWLIGADGETLPEDRAGGAALARGRRRLLGDRPSLDNSDL